MSTDFHLSKLILVPVYTLIQNYVSLFLSVINRNLAKKLVIFYASIEND